MVGDQVFGGSGRDTSSGAPRMATPPMRMETEGENCP